MTNGINKPTILTQVQFETGAATYLDFPIDWSRILRDAKGRGEKITGVKQVYPIWLEK